MSRKEKLCMRKLMLLIFHNFRGWEMWKQFSLLSSKFSLWFAWLDQAICRWQFWRHHDDWVRERGQLTGLPSSSTKDYRLPSPRMPEWYRLLQPTNSTAISERERNEVNWLFYVHRTKHGIICCSFAVKNTQIRPINTHHNGFLLFWYAQMLGETAYFDLYGWQLFAYLFVSLLLYSGPIFWLENHFRYDGKSVVNQDDNQTDDRCQCQQRQVQPPQDYEQKRNCTKDNARIEFLFPFEYRTEQQNDFTETFQIVFQFIELFLLCVCVAAPMAVALILSKSRNNRCNRIHDAKVIDWKHRANEKKNKKENRRKLHVRTSVKWWWRKTTKKIDNLCSLVEIRTCSVLVSAIVTKLLSIFDKMIENNVIFYIFDRFLTSTLAYLHFVKWIFAPAKSIVRPCIENLEFTPSLYDCF